MKSYETFYGNFCLKKKNSADILKGVCCCCALFAALGVRIESRGHKNRQFFKFYLIQKISKGLFDRFVYQRAFHEGLLQVS